MKHHRISSESLAASVGPPGQDILRAEAGGGWPTQRGFRCVGNLKHSSMSSCIDLHRFSGKNWTKNWGQTGRSPLSIRRENLGTSRLFEWISVRKMGWWPTQRGFRCVGNLNTLPYLLPATRSNLKTQQKSLPSAAAEGWGTPRTWGPQLRTENRQLRTN